MRQDIRTFQVGGMLGAGGVGKLEAALGELLEMMRVAISLEPGLVELRRRDP
jgi:hypothetical protein